MSICLRYSKDKNTASESLNMGYLKILKSLNTYNPEMPFKVWVRRIMVNTLIDEYRKNRREREKMVYVEDYFDSYNFSEVNEAISKFDCKQIYDEINKLPESTKKVFNLFVIDGYSHKEIGVMLDISEGTSKWHLNAARQKLKEQIKDYDFQVSTGDIWETKPSFVIVSDLRFDSEHFALANYIDNDCEDELIVVEITNPLTDNNPSEYDEELIEADKTLIFGKDIEAQIDELLTNIL
jgi:RNA polymerase sigma-70 factor (ECF subfamily)